MARMKHKFMVDAMFGKLGRILRLMGWDTNIAHSQLADAEIAVVALREDRLLITHDRAFYQKTISQNNPGYYLTQKGLHNQLLALFRDLAMDPVNLINSAKYEQQRRCSKCNALVSSISKEQIIDILPVGTAKQRDRFWRCTNETCRQIYWIGAHWENLQQLFTGVYTDLMNAKN